MASQALVHRYTPTAQTLHWVMALCIAGSFAMGLYMSDLPLSPTRLKLFNWHKWAGVTILALALLRLAWRLTHRPPEHAPMPAWQQRAAGAVHFALYALFFAVPLVGWAYSSASGFPIVWFGVLPLPDFVAPDRSLAGSLKSLHETLAWLLAGLVALHVAAALKHAFIDRNRLLLRMWPGRD